MHEFADLDVSLTPFQEAVLLTLLHANHRGLWPNDLELAQALECEEEDVTEAMRVLEILGFAETVDG